jgi:hypothetical protein
VTAHPSSILHARDVDRTAAMRQFVAALELVASWLGPKNNKTQS